MNTYQLKRSETIAMNKWIGILLVWCVCAAPAFAKDWQAPKVYSAISSGLFGQTLNRPDGENFSFSTGTDGKFYGNWKFDSWTGTINAFNDTISYKLSGGISFSSIPTTTYPDYYLNSKVYGDDLTLKLTLWSTKYPEPVDLYLMSYIEYFNLISPLYQRPYTSYQMQLSERCGYSDWQNQYLNYYGIIQGSAMVNVSSVPEPDNKLTLCLLFLLFIQLAFARRENSTYKVH